MLIYFYSLTCDDDSWFHAKFKCQLCPAFVHSIQQLLQLSLAIPLTHGRLGSLSCEQKYNNYAISALVNSKRNLYKLHIL